MRDNSVVLFIVLLVVICLIGKQEDKVKDKDFYNTVITFLKQRNEYNKKIDYAKLCSIIEKNATLFEIDKYLVFSICFVESSLREKVINTNENGTFDVGLMQVNTIHTNDIKFLLNTETNVFLACKILKANLIKTSNVYKAVKNYNGDGKKADIYTQKIFDTYFNLRRVDDISGL